MFLRFGIYRIIFRFCGSRQTLCESYNIYHFQCRIWLVVHDRWWYFFVHTHLAQTWQSIHFIHYSFESVTISGSSHVDVCCCSKQAFLWSVLFHRFVLIPPPRVLYMGFSLVFLTVSPSVTVTSISNSRLRKLHVGVVSWFSCSLDFIFCVASHCYYDFVSDVLASRNL
jgi:hypothetical protein